MQLDTNPEVEKDQDDWIQETCIPNVRKALDDFDAGEKIDLGGLGYYMGHIARSNEKPEDFDILNERYEKLNNVFHISSLLNNAWIELTKPRGSDSDKIRMLLAEVESLDPNNRFLSILKSLIQEN